MKTERLITMPDLRYQETVTQGYLEYEKKFGDFELPDLPWQLDAFCGCLPTPPGQDEYHCVELGEYLGECAKSGKRATVRGYVDALYLSGGKYRSDRFGVEESDFKKFISRVSAFDYDF